MNGQLKVLHMNLHHAKAVQAVDHIARVWPGVTQYYVCKVLYFADKSHCVDWGRTISGDRYVAMDHGPVPSRIYEMLKPASGEEDGLLEEVSSRLTFGMEGNKIHIYSQEHEELTALSDSDIEHLNSAIEFCRPLSFGELRDISHKELAWKNASEDETRNNPPMDLSDWFDGEEVDREQAAQELLDNARIARPVPVHS